MTSISLQHFRIENGNNGVVTIWIDVADRSMNVFDDRVIHELDSIVTDLERRCSSVSSVALDAAGDRGSPSAAPEPINAVIFRSAKPSGFFAGADINQIAKLKDREQIEAVLLRGQSLFARIEDLAVPTIAAIHGPCLGGGLEFALACSHRIARNGRTTRLGLPEVQLGLIPGWGGTQRLPKLVGLLDALPMILKGKKLSASAALRTGLVDAIADDESWDDFINQFAVRIRERAPSKRSWKARLARSVMDSTAGHWLILHMAKKRVARDARHYPALFAALRAIAGDSGPLGRADSSAKALAGSSADPADGYAVERAEFANLMDTATCRSLLNLFLWREKARSMSQVVPAAKPAVQIDTATRPRPQLGVIGAGVMGAGIGQLAALKGFRVVLKELTPELAESGMTRVVGLLNGMVAGKRLSPGERDEIANRISVTDSFDDLKDCDLVIEAIVEKPQVKESVFARLDAVLKPNAIIVSNTSALSVTEMAKATARADRVAGLHFFNPVHRMDLVELVRTPATSDQTVDRLLQVVRKLGKTPVITTDSPGFLVNRVLFPYIGEAVRMVMEGHDCRTLDREVKRFGMPMGPIELIDHVGIDVAWHVASTLEDVLPESADVIRLLGQMVARGCTGSKSGRGFYEYTDGRRSSVGDLSSLLTGTGTKHRTSAPTADADGTEDGQHENVGRFLPDGLTEIQRRLIYPMINETGFCMQDAVVAEAWMADLAMILGTGFAPFRGGPITLADSIDRETLLNNLHVLSARHGERFKPSAWLVERNRRSNGTGKKQRSTV